MQEQLPSEIRGLIETSSPDFATLYPGYGQEPFSRAESTHECSRI